MARGKKYDEETKEKALAMLATEPDIKKVSQALNIPRQTLVDWKADAIINEPDFVKLRQEKKAEFINSAWEVIHLATEQVKAKIHEAGPGEAARVAGIFFDKQALASGDPTDNVNTKMQIVLEGELDEWSR